MHRLSWTTALFVALCCGVDPVERAAAEYLSLLSAMERGEGSVERARALEEQLSRLEPTSRAGHLKRQAEAIVARYQILGEEQTTFDEESRRLFGAVAPAPDLEEARKIRDELDRLLPGEGALLTRYVDFQRRFLVPRERLGTVLERAIAECRRRTLEQLQLPREEVVRLELVSGKDWPSYSSYRGRYQSVILVNEDVPFPIGRIVDVAAHEAYPGHHTESVLLDERLVQGEGLAEYSVEPPVGPDALLREGLAAFAEEIVFSEEERLAFERDVLFPLAGLQATGAELHAKVERLVDRLRPLAVDGARQYLDRKRDRVASATWLENEALVPDPWAFLRFVDRYRTYVIAYTVGRDLVRGRAGSHPWRSFRSLLLDPYDAT